MLGQIRTSYVTFALLKNYSVKCALVVGTQELKAEKLSQNCYHEREQITVSYVLDQVKTTSLAVPNLHKQDKEESQFT